VLVELGYNEVEVKELARRGAVNGPHL
jgi:hypothetical protein